MPRLISRDAIWVVIPVHGRIGLTRECLNSLRNQTVSGFNVLVVDDGSPDQTRSVLRSDYPEVEVLETDGGLWWSGAMNLGVQYALQHGAGYILSVNNDTVLAREFVAAMASAAAQHPHGLMGSLMRNRATGQIVYAGERINWFTAGGQQLANSLNQEGLSGLVRVTHCPGRGLWIPVPVFEEVGCFDAEAFPQTLADYDFSMRAGSSGYSLYCNLDAVVLTSGDVLKGARKQEPVDGLRGLAWVLTSIKSGGHLAGRVRLARRHAPWLKKPTFIIASALRVSLGYLLRQWRGGVPRNIERTCNLLGRDRRSDRSSEGDGS